MKLYFSGAPKSDGSVELTPPGVSLGRELDNDIIVEAEAASRYHCKVLWRDGDWYLKDLGSTNGTKLNGLKVSDEIKLKEGDEIAIGYQKLIFGVSPARKASGGVSPAKEGGTENLSPAAVKPASKGTSPQSFFGSLFSADKEKGGGADDQPEKSKYFQKEKVERPDEGAKKKHAGMLFYLIVVLFAFVLVAGFLLIEKLLSDQKAKTNPGTKKPADGGAPLSVIYEKQISTPDNIFRYELRIKDNKISVERDDLKHSIRFRRQQEVAPELLENLKAEIKNSDFIGVAQPQAGVSPDNSDETKVLTIAYGTSLNSVRIKNAFEPTPFREAVNAIESFSNDILNIPTISLTADEMKKEAEDAYAKAEMLFANKNAKRENLKEAVKRYAYVIELLEFFEPKPAMYDQAYRKSQEAKKLLDDEVKQHEINAQQATRLQRWDDAIEAYRAITEMLDPDDKRYQTAKGKILRMEEAVRTIKKGKKK